MYEIEKGIEPPKGQMGRRRSYPFPDMEIGDSFFVPFEEGDLKVKAAVQAAATHYGKRHGMKFATRSIEGGIRVWRLA